MNYREIAKKIVELAKLVNANPYEILDVIKTEMTFNCVEEIENYIAVLQ